MFTLALSFLTTFLRSGRQSPSWLVALMALALKETLTRLAFLQSVPSLTLSLHPEDNAPLSPRCSPSPTYRAGPVHLNHSFEPPTGFSLQARSAIRSGFYISVGGSVFIFSLAKGSLFKQHAFPMPPPPPLCVYSLQHSCSYRYGKEQILWILFYNGGIKVLCFVPP